LPRTTLVWALTLALACASAAAAERDVEVTPFIGYRIGGEFDDLQGGEVLEVHDGSSWGVDVEIAYPRKRGAIGFRFSRQDTELEARTGVLVPAGSRIGIDIDHFEFAGLRHIGATKSRVRPFAGMTMGLTLLGVEGGSDETRFNIGFTGGGKIWFSPRLGLRLEGRITSTYFADDSAVACGFPPGACYLSTSGSLMTQLESIAGLMVKF
jgi:hypothetical protein